MRLTMGLRAAALAALLLVLRTDLAPAQVLEIPWQTDYSQARAQAVRANRPLLLSFSSQNCLWCTRLHATTFHDPTIAARIARDFIPLAIQAEQSPSLVQALHIQGFPAMVMATPEGCVIHQVDGYVDATAMGQHLHLASSRVQQYQAYRRQGESRPGPAASASPQQPAPAIAMPAIYPWTYQGGWAWPAMPPYGYGYGYGYYPMR